MKVKALVSFAGAFSMYKGEVKECKDKVILKDLLNAGNIEKVKQSNIEEIKNNEEANEEESEYNED